MLKVLFMAALLAPVKAQSAVPVSVAPEKVISAITGDWNDDGSMDHAVLVEGGDADAALFVYLSDGSGELKLAAYAPSIAFAGQMFGTVPELQLSKSGALQVHSQNSAVGRDRWERTLTLAYRDKSVIVAGITASSYDTLDPKNGGSCDVNLLTGKGKAGKAAVTVKAGGVPVADWTDDKVPPACQ